ncbi:hypothetical protein Tco_0123962, partial [Tanacetum coccineum]
LSTDKPFVSTDRPFLSTDRSITPNVSAASTPTGANAGESSFVYLGRKIPMDASTLSNSDLPIDPNMLDFEDASDTLPDDGIFNGAYDDDKDVGALADFNNMDNTIAISPIPTLRIHKDHLKGQILGDPTSAVQTKRKIQKASSTQQALVIESMKMKQKSTNFVTRTKASGEAQEEDISPIILEVAKTLSKVASQGVSKVKSTDKGRDIGGEQEVSTGSTEVDSGTASKRGQREGNA